MLEQRKDTKLLRRKFDIFNEVWGLHCQNKRWEANSRYNLNDQYRFIFIFVRGEY